MSYSRTGLINSATDNSTLYTAEELVTQNGYIETQLIGSLLLHSQGVSARYGATSFKVTADSGLSVSIAAGAGNLYHSTKGAVAFERTTPYTLEDIPASVTRFLFATYEDSEDNNTIRSGVPYFVLNETDSLANGLPLARIVTDADSVTAVDDLRVFATPMRFRGEWDNAVDYDFNDIVTHDGELWYAKQDNVAVEPEEAAEDDWLLLVAKGTDGEDGAPGEDGEPGGSLDWRGNWTAATAYVVDDAVQHGTRKSSYRCKADHTASSTNEPGTGANWQTYWILFAQAGETGATGVGEPGTPGTDGLNGVVWRGEWSSLVEYRVNDAVSYNGNSYVATATSTNIEPPNGAYWDVLAARGEAGTGGIAGTNHAFTLYTRFGGLPFETELTVHPLGEESESITVHPGLTGNQVRDLLEGLDGIVAAEVTKQSAEPLIIISNGGSSENGVFSLPTVDFTGGGTLTLDFDDDDFADIVTKVRAITGYADATVQGSGDYEGLDEA